MDWKLRIEQLLADGSTVDQVARHMEVTPNAVREILAGRTKQPRANAAMKLLTFQRPGPPAAPSQEEEGVERAA